MKTTISDFFTFNVGDTFTIPENPDVYDFIHGSDILQFVFVETQSGFVKPFAPEMVFFILKSPQTEERIQVSGEVADFIRSCNNLAEAMQKLAPLVSRLADGEGLMGHKQAADIRYKES